MTHNSPRLSPGNDGFGYHEPERFDETPFLNPVIEAEAQRLVNIVTDNSLHGLERKAACNMLFKHYGDHYLDPEHAEYLCNDTTEEVSELSELSEQSEQSDSDSSDSSDASEWFCPKKVRNGNRFRKSKPSETSSEAVASQSMGQHLSPDKTDSKGE
jgi:hypothetical protein